MTQVLICSEALFMYPTSDYSAGGFVEVIQKEHLFQVYSLNHGRIFDPVSRKKQNLPTKTAQQSKMQFIWHILLYQLHFQHTTSAKKPGL